MTEQPEAMRLAEIMSQKAKGQKNELGDHWAPVWCEKAAAELRRLHHNNEVLMNALWKACGDDEEVVNATIESQGELK
jgi:hypothetical protein